MGHIFWITFSSFIFLTKTYYSSNAVESYSVGKKMTPMKFSGISACLILGEMYAWSNILLITSACSGKMTYITSTISIKLLLSWPSRSLAIYFFSIEWIFCFYHQGEYIIVIVGILDWDVRSIDLCYRWFHWKDFIGRMYYRRNKPTVVGDSPID